MTDTDLEQALRRCGEDPVHLIGEVQGFGAVLAFDRELCVVAASEGIESLVGTDAVGVLGRSDDDLLGREASHALRGAMGVDSFGWRREPIGAVEVAGREVDLAAFGDGDLTIVELEPARSRRPRHGVAGVRAMLARLEPSSGPLGLLQAATALLRNLTGFDRVMAYRFLHDGAGEVVAESVAPHVQSFLGLRFPAHDVPPQARKIAVAAPVRVIADVGAPQAAIRGAAGTLDRPLDLTLAHSRGVAPVHAAYLRNMGVRASMSLSIVIGGRLWGLFACHHERPRLPSPDDRALGELLVSFLSLQVQQELERAKMERRQLVEATAAAVSTASTASIRAHISERSADMLKIVAADGLAWLTPSEMTSVGLVPSRQALRDLREVPAPNGVATFDRASDFGGAELHGVAGAMLLRPSGSDAALVLLREQVTSTIRWAGQPRPDLARDGAGPRIDPRHSFAEYKEAVAGRSEPWTDDDVDVGLVLRDALAAALRHDPAAAEATLERQRRQATLLASELSHRVKNVLALVRSIARQTQSSTVSLETYADAFEKRITALANAHELAGHGLLEPASLATMVQSELAPYEGRAGVTTAGSEVAIRGDLVPIIALALHELATNAAKYGALSGADGQLAVGWSMDREGLVITWEEAGLDSVVSAPRRGFGLALIERSVPYECGGTTSVDFGGRRLSVRIRLPADAVVVLEPAPPRADADEPASPSRADDAHNERPVLVVEDQALVALDLERTLQDLGFSQVYCVSNEADALRLVGDVDFAAALLDVNLGSTNSFRVADELLDRRVPLLFLTGYKRDIPNAPEHLQAVKTLTKPADKQALADALRRVIDRG